MQKRITYSINTERALQYVQCVQCVQYAHFIHLTKKETFGTSSTRVCGGHAEEILRHDPGLVAPHVVEQAALLVESRLLRAPTEWCRKIAASRLKFACADSRALDVVVLDTLRGDVVPYQTGQSVMAVDKGL